MKRSTLVAGLTLAALSGASGGCTQSDQYLQFAAPVDVAGFVEAATRGERMWTRAALALRFGDPITETQEGDRVLLAYYGFELGIEADSLIHIAFTDSRHTAPEGIRVGYAATQVRRLWGPPKEQTWDLWTYETQGADLILTITEGVVSRIAWHLRSAER